MGKSTRPFRHDLNLIPYDYRVEVRNRFKGLDLIECLMNYGSSYDGDLSLPLGWALGSPIFPSGCEGKLGVALESLQG